MSRLLAMRSSEEESVPIEFSFHLDNRAARADNAGWLQFVRRVCLALGAVSNGPRTGFDDFRYLPARKSEFPISRHPPFPMRKLAEMFQRLRMMNRRIDSRL